MDIYCKLSKCIGQTPCSYEHYLVLYDDCVVVLMVMVKVLHQQSGVHDVLRALPAAGTPG